MGMAGSSSIASHARQGAQPGDKDQMSSCSQGAGKAATSAQPGSSQVPARAGTDPPLSPRPRPPRPTGTALRHTSSPALITAPPLLHFGIQMAGDSREWRFYSTA